jgi:formylglycine-generating enzyme required for sulfatase activity
MPAKLVHQTLLCVLVIVLAASCQGNSPVATADTSEERPGLSQSKIPTATQVIQLPATITLTPGTPVLGDRIIRQKDAMEMVFVPAGEFMMGSDEDEVDRALEQCLTYGSNCARRYFSVEMPMHLVKLDSYWIDSTEVTNGQYQLCVLEGVCTPTSCSSGGDAYPVVCITWEQAEDYCQWAGARLPSEAEWEYSARGSDGKRYPWGNEFDGTRLNYCDSNCPLSKKDADFDDGYAESAPAGSFLQGASWVGALDMAGNVWEMVADWNGNYPADEQLNPSGPETGSRRVARGGSWHASPDHVRSTLRTHLSPQDAHDHAGFRCALPNP